MAKGQGYDRDGGSKSCHLLPSNFFLSCSITALSNKGTSKNSSGSTEVVVKYAPNPRWYFRCSYTLTRGSVKSWYIASIARPCQRVRMVNYTMGKYQHFKVPSRYYINPATPHRWYCRLFHTRHLPICCIEVEDVKNTLRNLSPSTSAVITAWAIWADLRAFLGRPRGLLRLDLKSLQTASLLFLR